MPFDWSRIGQVGFAVLSAVAIGTDPLVAKAPVPSAAQVAEASESATLRGASRDVIRLWYLYLALPPELSDEAATEQMRSMLWWAIGAEGLCPEGLDHQRDKLGLWSLVVYNELLANRRPRPLSPGARTVGPSLVRMTGPDARLTLAEWRSLKLVRGPCDLRENHLERARLTIGETKAGDTRMAQLMAAWQALETARVAVPEAQTKALLGHEASRLRLALYRAGVAIEPPSLGLWEPAMLLALDERQQQELAPYWAEGLAPHARQGELLRVIDAAIAADRGEDLSFWLGLYAAHSADRGAIWRSPRGERLARLGSFPGRGVIALYRAADALERRDLAEGLAALHLAREAGVDVGEWVAYVWARHGSDLTADQRLALGSVDPKAEAWRQALAGASTPPVNQSGFDETYWSALRGLRADLVVRDLRDEQTRSEASRFVSAYLSQLELSPFALVKRHRSFVQAVCRALPVSDPRCERLAPRSEDSHQALGAAPILPPAPTSWFSLAPAGQSAGARRVSLSFRPPGKASGTGSWTVGFAP